MAISKKQSNKNAVDAAKVAKSQSSQAKNSKVEKESMPMGKMNYILMGVSLLLIVAGFVLMSGSGNEGTTFNNDVFSSTRIVVAPMLTFLGFLCMVPAILYKRKKDDDVPSLDAANDKPASNVIVKGN